jgi:hypothetical protein
MMATDSVRFCEWCGEPMTRSAANSGPDAPGLFRCVSCGNAPDMPRPWPLRWERQYEESESLRRAVDTMSGAVGDGRGAGPEGSEPLGPANDQEDLWAQVRLEASAPLPDLIRRARPRGLALDQAMTSRLGLVASTLGLASDSGPYRPAAWTTLTLNYVGPGLAAPQASVGVRSEALTQFKLPKPLVLLATIDFIASTVRAADALVHQFGPGESYRRTVHVAALEDGTFTTVTRRLEGVGSVDWTLHHLDGPVAVSHAVGHIGSSRYNVAAVGAPADLLTELLGHLQMLRPESPVTAALDESLRMARTYYQDRRSR